MATGPSLDRSAGNGGVGPFTIFALIWALTTLVHQLSFTFWLQTWQGPLVTFATCLVILEPRCLVRFTLLLLFSLLNLGNKLPFVPNHILFEGLLNLTILIAILWAAWRERTNLPNGWLLVEAFWNRFWPFLLTAAVKCVHLQITTEPRNPILGGTTSALLLVGLGLAVKGRPPVTVLRDRIVNDFAPILRAEIVIMYLWAALQKLNHDYFDPEVSCAARLHTDIASYFPFVPTSTPALHVAIWGSILLEVGIPVLLCIRRTRFAGFIAAICFHLWLSIHPAPGIYSYSSLILGALFLFLPREAAGFLPRLWEHQTGWLRRQAPQLPWDRLIPRGVVALFLITVLVQATLYLKMGRTMETFGVVNRVGFTLWFTWGLWIGTHYLLSLRQTRSLSRAWPNRPAPTLAWIVVLVVITNGLNPWIGLKTQTSFSMYSNLRTEAFGNHVFLKRVDIFDFQRDLVELIESDPDLLAPPDSPRRIQQFANTGRIFPYFELRRLVSEKEGDVRLVYRRDGEELKAWRLGDATGGDPLLFQPLPLWQYKTLWFRRHESFDGPMHCTH